MQTHHEITVGNVTRKLPITTLPSGVRLAVFNIIRDWELTEAIGIELAKKIPRGVTGLVMPEGKALALLHVMGRESKLPIFVARKECKSYMRQPIRSVPVKSITTERQQHLFFGDDDAALLEGRPVAFVDDVISSGGSYNATCELLTLVQAHPRVVAMAAFTEGDLRPNVISLGHLPLF